MDILKKFLKYVSYETTSIEESDRKPSSEKEDVLLDELKMELSNLGVSSIIKKGTLYAKIKSDSEKKNTLLLMAHIDTSGDAKGSNISPRIVKYNGNDIKLDEEKTLSLPNKYLGHSFVVTDGSTLLGADDKAGIAIIMDSVETALKRGGYPNIIICFTSDEEIGRGTQDIDIEYIKEGQNKIYSYTLDGGDINYISYENFNAAHAKVVSNGISIHPSIGKGRLINSQEIIMEFHSLLPNCRPENTENKEGFIHLTNSSGSIELTTYDYILRSFSLDELEEYKKAFLKAKDIINNKYQKNLIEVSINDQYKNMKEIIDKDPLSVKLAFSAYEELGIDLYSEATRGGTDGANLSFLGLSCPNLGTGGGNFHGVYEYLDIDQMKTMSKIILKMMEKID